jgi:Flp pilus assembly protein TadD
MSTRLACRLSLALFVVTLVVFLPVVSHGFCSYDDNDYVFENAAVRGGLSRAGVAWAWTALHASNWHPLTWLSHMLDCQLFGLHAGGHHAVNLLWHLLNSVGLFWVLRRLTREDWRPALVAVLFALHPLHVESVAWVAERKDVLSTFFAVLTVGAYALYAEQPGPWRYLAVLAAFALGLLAKPMLVTLPLVLLLLDVWPLGRTATVGWRRLALEKVPLLGLSAGSCAVTLLAQRLPLTATGLLPLPVRLENAVMAYAAYLRKTLWPTDLAVLYPHPGAPLPWWQVGGAALLLAGLTVLAFALRGRRPALLVGWLWYLGTLVPVIGVVQVGWQALADRYTYLPLVGVFIALAWALPAPHSGRLRIGLVAAAAVVLAACAVLARVQVGYWRSDRALWERTLAVTPDNPVARIHLGAVLFREGRLDEAERQFALSLQGPTQFPQAFNNLATCLRRRGEVEQAVAMLSRWRELEPAEPRCRNGLGLAFAQQGRWAEARDQFREARRLRPDVAEYHFNLATALHHCCKDGEADAAYAEGLRLDPAWPRKAERMAQALTGCPPEAALRSEQARLALQTPGERGTSVPR